MNFITFPVAATNIFPASNSLGGGQLVTEWNLRSKDMVSTNPEIQYPVGPSFVHGESDFEVSLLSDSGGAIVNQYTLSIAEGRGVINGHYVETLVPMTIDLLEANAKLLSQSRPPLNGQLTIGIRTFYATEQTVAGSILVENEDDMFLGVQLVVLPTTEFITPADSPTDPNAVTADIELATFTFINNRVSAIQNSTTKLTYLSPTRIANIDSLVSNKYVTKAGLNSKKIYAFAGKGTNPRTGFDTWEDVTNSLIVWDNEPQRTSTEPSYQEAQFVSAANDVYMVLPHTQVEGMTDDDGNPEYYASKVLKFPTANYSTNTPGVVNKEYTRQIKDIATQVSNFRSTLTGKQIYYIDVRTSSDELPQINDGWAIGDYVLVREDSYFQGTNDIEAPPATMYVVLPGQVKEIQFVVSEDGDSIDAADFPSEFTGAQLGYQEWYFSAGQQTPETVDPAYYPTFFADDDVMRGIPRNSSTGEWVDYFRVRYFLEENEEQTHPYRDYYYGVATSGPREWSDAVLVTGSIQLATEDTIGGFYNASEDATDNGYVYLDDSGHLKLIDYQLLRSGTLAYQLGANLTLPSNVDMEEVQNYLDESVNERVAFPATVSTSANPPLIHLYLNLSESEEAIELNIRGIDSRFNTAVCLHVLGTPNSNVTINIIDCEKFRIDPSIEGTAIINVFRTCLYYDPTVFQYIRTCYRDSSVYGSFTGFSDIKLWYAKLESDDPNLLVNDMTVSELDAQIISSEIDYWKETGTSANDNHYLVALKSITFSGTADIVACEVLTANNSTDNVDPGDKIVVGEFTLPQGTSLVYPTACLTRVLKVTGEFTSAYYSDSNWYVTDNSFSLATGVYSAESPTSSIVGTIAFHSITTLVPSTISQTSISVWEPDSYHVFRGGAIS